MLASQVVHSVVIVATLTGVALGRFPWLRMNRATIALVGATTLVALGALSLEEAYSSLDLDTLTLLFAMMILNANLRLAGFFRLVNSRIIRWTRSPRMLLATIIVASGLLSAIFLNDTIVLVFTPLVLEVTQSLRRDPIPYLIGLVSAANIGSMATITGNPQNMLIGMASGIPYLVFTAYLIVPAIVGLFIAWVVIVLVYHREFSTNEFDCSIELPARPYRPLLRKSLLATCLMIVAFVSCMSIPLAALMAASLLLVTRRLKPERVFREIDWSLLVFFSGLFIVTGAIEKLGLVHKLVPLANPSGSGRIVRLAVVAMILSNLISNVPAVMLFRPIIPTFPDPQKAWLTLAMASTLAGNLTLLGSVANLIVAELAKREGVHLSFTEYLKTGMVITLLTLAVGTLWLLWI